MEIKLKKIEMNMGIKNKVSIYLETTTKINNENETHTKRIVNE